MNKRITAIVISLLTLILAACTASTPQPTATPAATPIPVPSPKCKDNTCIRQAFATIKGDSLRIEFDLTDKNGKVEFGNTPEFSDEITVGAYRLEKDGTENYLFGVQLPNGKYVCYAGNDLPWTNGQLGASCGFALPINIIQVRLQAGDLIRLEQLEFDFGQTIIVKEE